MIVISRHVAIPDGEIVLSAIRAQGAGGQHVNKTSTAIHLRFDIQASSLPEYYKERLLAASHHLISSDGVIVIKAQEYRSQELNREAAIARLVAMIKELTTEKKVADDRRGPPVHRKSDRLASKAQKSSVKVMRGKVRSGRRKEGMDGEKSDSDSDGCNQPVLYSDGCNNRAEAIRFLRRRLPN